MQSVAHSNLAVPELNMTSAPWIHTMEHLITSSPSIMQGRFRSTLKRFKLRWNIGFIKKSASRPILGVQKNVYWLVWREKIFAFY
jgi:hypothetical protein